MQFGEGSVSSWPFIELMMFENYYDKLLQYLSCFKNNKNNIHSRPDIDYITCLMKDNE